MHSLSPLAVVAPGSSWPRVCAVDRQRGRGTTALISGGPVMTCPRCEGLCVPDPYCNHDHELERMDTCLNFGARYDPIVLAHREAQRAGLCPDEVTA